jgi:hypothetical protein
MSIPFNPIGPGVSARPFGPGMGSVNMGYPDSLTQVQFNRDSVDIVTHFDKGFDPVPAHTVTKFDYNGNLTQSW